MIPCRLLILAGLLGTGASLAHQLPAPRAMPVARPAVARSAGGPDAASDDARRAAAGRLLVASRFRERQAVVLEDGVRAAEAEQAAACLDRAAAGRDPVDCHASADTPAVRARLAARRAAMLDEIMVASQTIYARRFTADEMDEIIRFFRTPVGRKYGDLYPQVIGEVQARRSTIIRRYLADATRGAGR